MKEKEAKRMRTPRLLVDSPCTAAAHLRRAFSSEETTKLPLLPVNAPGQGAQPGGRSRGGRRRRSTPTVAYRRRPEKKLILN
ncbi:hypothetical protein BHE74_00011055 [Ensete ventricosum]|nr:hypothetical protein BHE74_00011055 [Ensete ventricosum]